MDAIAGLLDGPRARDAFLLRSSLASPWSLRIEDGAPLTVVAVVAGDAWLLPDGSGAAHVSAGDVAIVRGPGHYTVADAPDTAPQVVIHPGQVCTTLAGEPLAERFSRGVRTWGNSADGPTQLLTGTYADVGDVSHRLLRALPTLVVLRADEWDCPVVPLLADEMRRDEPGQEAVLDRLLDLLVIAALRAWCARSDDPASSWYRASADPVVGPVLRLMQDDPRRGWTIATLAAEVGVSRATLAKRFAELVGEPPMTFLTNWRITLAADLLREPGATIGSVAEQVGYGSPFALSAAFKRLRGVSPDAHRRAAA